MDIRPSTLLRPALRAASLLSSPLCAVATAQQVVELSGPLARNDSGSVVESAFTPGGARVVFRRQRAGNVVDLYSAPADGSLPEVRLSPSSGGVASFQLEADGSHVVFLATTARRLMRAPVDGSAPAHDVVPLLAVGRAIAAYTLGSGREVVYVSDERADDVLELYVVPSDGSAPARRLNSTPVAGGDVLASDAARPAISPDGSFVVYVADEEVDGLPELFAAPLAPGLPAFQLSGAPMARGVVDFRIGPDSRWVVYRAWQDEADTLELFAARADGRHVPLKLNGDLPAGGDVGAFDSCTVHFCGEIVEQDAFSITPDGRHVVYTADQEVLGVHALYGAPLGRARRGRIGSGRAAPLRIGPAGAVMTDFHRRFELDPASGRAVFLAEVGGEPALYAAPADRHAPVRLDAGDEPFDFRVAPRGGRVLYFRDADGGVAVAPVDGSGPALELGVAPDDLAAAFSEDGERVLFTDRDLSPFGTRAFAVRIDGTGLVALSEQHAALDDMQDRAGRMTFRAGGSLYSTTLDSGGEVRLDGGPAAPGPVIGSIEEFRISPDELFAVYRGDQETFGAVELFRVELHGTRAWRRISPALPWGAGVVAGGFAITPDTRSVVYVADQEEDGRNELYVVPAEGGADALRLSGVPVAGGDVTSGFVVTSDSRWVVYRADAEQDERFELFSAPLDASEPARKLNGTLVANGDVLPNPDGFGRGFAVSPDGSWVVYRADQATDLRAELFAVPVDGSAPARRLNAPLTPAASVYPDFDVSADSGRVVYRTHHQSSTSFALYAAAIDGSSAPYELNHPLFTPYSVQEFALAPDGSRAVYVSTSQSSELYSVPLDRSEEPVLLSIPGVVAGGVDAAESWLPSFRIVGSQVVFRADPHETWHFELFTAPLDGSAGPVKRSGGLYVERFDVQDGHAVATVNASGPRDLYLMPLAGAPSPLLVQAGASGFLLPPGGQHVFFARPGTDDHMAVRADASTPARRYAVEDDVVGLAATRDGSRALWLSETGSFDTRRLVMGFPARKTNRR